MLHRLPAFTPIALALFITACGGGGGGGGMAVMRPPPGGPGGPSSDPGPQPGNLAPYTTSVSSGVFGTTPVRVGDDSITIEDQTVALDASTQIDSRSWHYRMFDTEGATSGPATEVHIFGQNEGLSHLRFGSWAKGVVSPNPGFRIGEQFGAFLAPNTDSTPTPASNLPVAGTAEWRGTYAGYVDREGVGVSQVVGPASIRAAFRTSQIAAFGDGSVVITLGTPDPSRSSFAWPRAPVLAFGDPEVIMYGYIQGNTFESDVTATYTFHGQTLPRGDQIGVASDDLYSSGLANSGGVRGGFFGNRGGEAGGTYQFTIGTTRAAGSFGGKIQ